MMSARHIKRIFSINRVLVKHGLDEYLDNTPAKKYLWILRLLSFGAKAERSKPKGQRLREALTELGPIFVKFGQMLSTRRDLLDEELAIELAQLQDRVPPFSEEQAHQRIEQQLGSSVDSHFVNFERKPLASASMAQVHGATLHSGEEVVVKVIRPGIRKQLKHDLSLILDFANWLEKFVPETRRFKPTHVVKDYEATIFAELDLRVEAANTAQLKRNFENSELLYIPKVYWPLTREKVMVQERIGGIPIGDVKQLIAANTNMRELAHRGVEIFFTQVFRDSFFHADMHPGNIFVDVSNPNKPKYIGIDCGIMGTLGKEDKRYLAQNFLAFFDRDYRRIAELHVLSGWVPHDTSIEAFESAIRTACEPIFGKPLAEISFGHFLVQLFQVARRFEMEVQPQLVLLQKTLLYIEGLGRQLYPQLDLWETAQPFLKDWVKTQYGVKSIIDRVQQKWPTWVEYLPELPELVISALEQQGKDFSQEVSKQNNHSRPSTHSKATVFAIIGGSATILAGCLIVADVWNAAYISLGIGALGFIAALKSKSS